MGTGMNSNAVIACPAILIVTIRLGGLAARRSRNARVAVPFVLFAQRTMDTCADPAGDGLT